MATGSTLLTVSGTPVELLPLSTPWPSGKDCASNIYEQLDGHFLAWDPVYGQSFDTAARTCFPPQVTSWWLNSATATSVALGPTFVCPEAYSAVQTALVAEETQYVYCCPSDYSLFVVQPTTTAAFPSQCTSLATPGQELQFLTIFQSGNGVAFSQATSIVESSTVTVFGIPVNGYNFAQSTSSTPSTTLQPTPSTTDTSIAASSHASSLASAGSAGSPVGVSVGVSVGVVLGVLALGAGAFFLWRRRRRRMHRSRVMMLEPPAEAQGLGPIAASEYEISGEGVKAELSADARVYELPGHFR
ncbi:hypothetical protein NKR23_g10833 [Pleurostoma richardsiae]|uniref:Uncharacterized protein n=1 Tax=Pleurostoma richardsiae TaxID=41990 RepID=A0AA38R967_9PEZI|nr:hypothetical protein NKR23_g10833 [Pleurostoma richardsiae]